MGYSPWGCKELDTTERVCSRMHTHTQCIWRQKYQKNNTWWRKMFTNNSGLMMTWFLCLTFLSCFLLRKPGERWQTSKCSIQHVPETLFQEHKAWSSILAGAGVREEGVTSIFPHPLAPSCLTHLPTSEGSLLFHKDFLSHGLLEEALLLFLLSFGCARS